MGKYEIEIPDSMIPKGHEPVCIREATRDEIDSEMGFGAVFTRSMMKLETRRIVPTHVKLARLISDYAINQDQTGQFVVGPSVANVARDILKEWEASK